MNMPLVSVCIPSYNYGCYISDAIDSVLAQEHQPIEVIVSDNGSTDETFEVLERYASDPRVRIFRNGRNLGIAGNINISIERATGEYIVVLSADDFLYPSQIRQSVARMLDPTDPVDVVYGGAMFVDRFGRAHTPRATTGLLSMNYSRRNEFASSLISCYVCMPTMIVPKRLYTELGGLDPEFTIACDWELTLRFAAAGKRFAFLAEPMTAVRLHADQASNFQNYSATGKGFSEYLHLLERYVTSENAWRFSGYEERIKRMFSFWNSHGATTELYASDTTLAPRSAKLISDLDAWSLQRSARPTDVPRVSIIMPTGGNLVTLNSAMESLAQQTFTSWEVVVHQSSRQNRESWLRSFPCADKIRHVRTDSHLTPAAARNYALHLVRGEYITYLDDDNVLHPDHLEKLVAMLDSSGADAVASGANLVIDDFVPMKNSRREPQVRVSDMYRTDADSRSSFLANSLPLNAVMHTVAAYDRIGGFRDDFAMLEDWEFLLRLENLQRLVFTGSTTLDVHNMLGFKGQQFLQYGPLAYVQLLDVIYATYPAPTLELAELRLHYRAELLALFSDFAARSASVNGIVDFLYRLAGRHIAFTAPFANAQAALTCAAS